MDTPTIPKGTRDFGPAQMAKRQFIFDNIKKVFQKYGFQPLETPAMENLSTLTGKYGEEGDQLLFRVLNSGDFMNGVNPADSGNSKLLSPQIAEKGLRYDLTVPFARYVVMHRHELAFPFRRYQLQPVWRADRPQKGRYREFYQCDADVVGTDSLLCEAEIILMIREIFASLRIDDYSIKMNHRAILSGLAELAGASEQESALFVALDKLDKIGSENVKEELRVKGVPVDGIARLFPVLDKKGGTTETIEFLASTFAASERGTRGVRELREILNFLKHFGSDETHVELDVALARGLSYYTGWIMEVKINNAAVGSVSGGGRYDNLTGVFGMPGVSGVGFSFGVDRIYDAMDALGLFPGEAQRSSRFLVAHTDNESRTYGLRVVQTLRQQGIPAEIFPDSGKLKKQLDYANKKMIPTVIVIGSEEMTDGLLTVKTMENGDQKKMTLDQILSLGQ
jgi:histidyl-tRNA synthetase